MRDVALTGLGSAGPWGVGEKAPDDPVRGITPFPGEAGEAGSVLPADEALIERVSRKLHPRQRRYLGRNGALAIAACDAALSHAAFPAERTAREDVACITATSRGATDPETSRELARAAQRGDDAPLARAAFELYVRRRRRSQYLFSMEAAVTSHVSAALGTRGSAHTVTTPGLAGGMQALFRAVRLVSTGHAPAALVCGVLTAEDPESFSAWVGDLEGTSEVPVIEGAGAMLVEDAEAVAHAGRSAWCVLRPLDETLDLQPDPPREWPATGLDEARHDRYRAGAALPMWWLAERSQGPLPATILCRGVLGHRFRVELLPAEGVAA